MCQSIFWKNAARNFPVLAKIKGRVMDYYIYKLSFNGGVHFGDGMLDDALFTFCADTFFSALCQEAVKQNVGKLEELLEMAKSGLVCFSDGLPFKGSEIFLPKPMLPACILSQNSQEQGSSTEKKLYKRLSYVPFTYFFDYVKGNYPSEHLRDFDGFGKKETRVNAFVRKEEDTLPYRTGVFFYAKENGICILAGFENDDCRNIFEELLTGLSFSGIGGKRSAGLGRFSFVSAILSEDFREWFEGTHSYYMTLSVSLPKEEEMEACLLDASYSIKKRSGFVASETYAKEYMKKKDLYVFSDGSCFKKKFQGDVYDVSAAGSHPVYRYAKPMYFGIDL